MSVKALGADAFGYDEVIRWPGFEFRSDDAIL
jgi:hypothetical protein